MKKAVRRIILLTAVMLKHFLYIQCIEMLIKFKLYGQIENKHTIFPTQYNLFSEKNNKLFKKK